LTVVAAAVFCGWAVAAPTEADGTSKGDYRVAASGGTGFATNLPPPITPSPAPAAGNASLSLVFYPLILLLLGAGAFYLMRSGWPSGFLRKNAPRKLQVPEIRPLGNRQFLVIAEYETTRILLGVSPGRIDLLCHLGRDAMEGEAFAPLVRDEPPKP
jgi:flagellar biogenesis protein FliO